MDGEKLHDPVMRDAKDELSARREQKQQKELMDGLTLFQALFNMLHSNAYQQVDAILKIARREKFRGVLDVRITPKAVKDRIDCKLTLQLRKANEPRLGGPLTWSVPVDPDLIDEMYKRVEEAQKLREQLEADAEKGAVRGPVLDELKVDVANPDAKPEWTTADVLELADEAIEFAEHMKWEPVAESGDEATGLMVALPQVRELASKMKLYRDALHALSTQAPFQPAVPVAAPAVIDVPQSTDSTESP